ncbi:hypothetical protein BJ684DRAFT_18391 [Piptocephalis cylindrospora]|uniref:SH3 domain-containing protein n=1 Tax=Piptocephalis cylindrospora TaxID=1907219 RepID=A0A4P9Y904_9FUNG|nr:hypothetical protein BJ684DRAFT_18391 [Piptocephalis cylindrospora]|eukprot:RKP15272.1 hypothetical protein BJ684DRAFT_18391 [Piptocephalis cylindrospora]
MHLPLLLLFSLLLVLFRSVKTIEVDWKALGSSALLGSYQGLSLYSSSSSSGVRSLPTSSSPGPVQAATLTLVNTTTSETNTLFASSGINASINALCTLPPTDGHATRIFFAGLFPSPTSPNIAVWEEGVGVVGLGPGLDGSVLSLTCLKPSSTYPKGRVIALGSFRGPHLPSISNSPPLPSYAQWAIWGGGVAIWDLAQDTWFPPPFKGLDAPVRSLSVPSSSSSALFGGEFLSVADGPLHIPPDSQPLPLSLGTLDLGNAQSPGNIICNSSSSTTNFSPATGAPSTPWSIVQGISGWWRLSLPLTFTPLLLRLWNLPAQGPNPKGARTFRLISRPDNQPITLSYIHPETNSRALCWDACPMELGGTRDFIIPPRLARSMQGLQLDITSWYGQGGGLAGVQIFQADIYVHAVPSYNPAACDLPVGNAEAGYVQATSTRTGLGWEEVVGPVGGKRVLALRGPSTAAALAATNPSLTLIPNVPETGIYEVWLYLPGCQIAGLGQGCASRATLSAVVYADPDAPTPTPVQVSPTGLEEDAEGGQRIRLYFGRILASKSSSSSFSPRVEIRVDGSVQPTGSSGVEAYIDAIQLVRVPSATGANGLLEVQGMFDDASAMAQWSRPSVPLPIGSVVTSVQHVDNSSRALVGGQFANFTAGYGNLVEWNQGQWVPLKTGAGVNGRVETIKSLGSGKGWLIGGDFTGPFSGTGALYGLGVYAFEEGWRTGETPGVAQGGVHHLAINTSPDREIVYAAGSFASVYLSDGSLHPELGGLAAYNPSGSSQPIWTGDAPFVRPIGSIHSLDFLHHPDQGSSLILGSALPLGPASSRLDAIHSGGITLIDSFSSSSAQTIPAGMDLLPAGSFPGRGPQQIRQVRAGAWVDQGRSILVSATLSDPSSAQTSWDGLLQRSLGPQGPWSLLSSSGLIHSMDTLRVGAEEIVFYTGLSSQGGRLLFGRWDAARGVHEDLPNTSGVSGEGRVVRWLGQGKFLLGGNFTSLAGLDPCTHVCVYDEWKGAWESPGSLSLQSGETILDAHYSREMEKTLLLLSSFSLLVKEDSSKEWARVDTSGWPAPIHSLSSSMARQGGSHFLLGGLQSTSDISTVQVGQWSGRPDDSPVWYLSTPGFPTSFSLQGVQVLPIFKDSQGGGTQPGIFIQGTGGAMILQDPSSPSSTWKPWIHISDDPGSSSSSSILRDCTVHHSDWSLAKGKGTMAAPLVVLVSAAISLGFIFIIVAAGLLGMHGRRRLRSRPGVTSLNRHVLLPLQSPSAAAAVPPIWARSIGEKDSGERPHPAILATAPYLSTRDVGQGVGEEGRPSMGVESNILPPGDPDQDSSYHSHSFEGSSSFLSRDMEGALTGAAVRLGGHDHDDPSSLHHEGGMEPDWLPADYQVYHAKHAFEAKESGELEIHAGDLVYVLDNTDPIWWMGLVDNGPGVPPSQGVFPASFVRERGE